MGKLSLTELTSAKLSKSLVNTLSAIQGGTMEHCHCDGNKNGIRWEKGDY